MWFTWHIRWKSTLESMGRIIRCASGVTNFTLTLELQAPISHISRLVLNPKKLTLWTAGRNPSPNIWRLPKMYPLITCTKKDYNTRMSYNDMVYRCTSMEIISPKKKKTHRALWMFSQAFLDNLWLLQRSWGVGKLLTPRWTWMWDSRDKACPDGDKRNK